MKLLQTRSIRPKSWLPLLAAGVTIVLTLACARGMQGDPGYFSVSGTRSAPALDPAASDNQSPFRRDPNSPIYTPTPDDPHPLPSARKEAEEYVVQAGDTLGIIAQKYGVSIEFIAQENNLTNPNLLDVGQKLVIPVGTPEGTGPDFKIIPDSELVFGPGSIGFDIASFAQEKNGFLAKYTEEVNGRTLSGPAIVQRIAQNYSVSPQLLLAVLEQQSGWVTHKEINKTQRQYPIGIRNPQRKGLYFELAWAANVLNKGYYLWRVNGVGNWVLVDGASVPIAVTINAGTAAIQHLYAQLLGFSEWTQAVSETGVFATYEKLFGYPFSYSFEPLLPENLEQPNLGLPFEKDRSWSFTGGPHGGWDAGSAWAALDFAPPGDTLGCFISDEWVTAMADGPIIRTGEGQVIQDLDGDGFEQTGWVILYLHIDSKARVEPGMTLKFGDRIGHPSCEGGVSSGTHLHIARRYNGEWIPADQDLPFVLDGWVSSGTGKEYDGFLGRRGVSIEAYAGRSETNQIQR